MNKIDRQIRAEEGKIKGIEYQLEYERKNGYSFLVAVSLDELDQANGRLKVLRFQKKLIDSVGEEL